MYIIIKRSKNDETMLKLYMIMTATWLVYVWENLTSLKQPEKRTETAGINFFSCRIYIMWPKHEGRNQVTKYTTWWRYCWLQMEVDTIFIKSTDTGIPKVVYKYTLAEEMQVNQGKVGRLPLTKTDQADTLLLLMNYDNMKSN